MAVDEINESNEFDFTFAPHLRDPGGVVAGYHTACADLIREERVDHIVGCYTSASRKQVIPIVERTERLLWHPARYEGFESSDNVIYVGAAPNQHVVPLVRHMLDHISTDVFCIRLQLCLDLGNEPSDSRNRDQRGRPHSRRTAARTRRDRGGPHRFKRSSTEGRRSCSIRWSGNPATSSCARCTRPTTRAGLSIPMLSCSLCEPELKLIGSAASVGCITSSAYFESIESA